MCDKTLLKDIIQVAFDGADFYDNALRRVKNIAGRSVFRRMADAKWDLVNTFSRRLTILGDIPPASVTSLGYFRKRYTDIRASLSSDHLCTYLSRIEETEYRLIDHLEKAIIKVEDRDLHFELKMYLSQVRACRTEMSDLKHQLGGDLTRQ